MNSGKNRSVGGRPSHAIGLQFLNERRFVEARRRLGKVLLRFDGLELQFLALRYRRQAVFELFVVFVLLVFAFLVHFEEALKLQNAASGAENIRRLALALGAHVNRRLIQQRRIHLRRNKAHPDQTVQLQLIFR